MHLGKMSVMKYNSTPDDALEASIQEEPVMAYISAQKNTLTLVWRLLGGVHFSPSQPVSEFSFYEWGKNGLSKSSIIALA